MCSPHSFTTFQILLSQRELLEERSLEQAHALGGLLVARCGRHHGYLFAFTTFAFWFRDSCRGLAVLLYDPRRGLGYGTL